MESIFAQTDTILILCNKNFEIIFANSSCEDLFLTSKNKIFNKKLDFFLDNFNKFMTSPSNHLTEVYLIKCMIIQLEINFTQSQLNVLPIILKLLFCTKFLILV